MSNDVYIEDSVSITNNGAKSMFVLSLICLVISAAGLLFASIFFGIPFVIFIVLSVHFYYERHVAYDYTYTNGLLDIAKVRNNTKRKLLFSAECDALEIMALNDSDDIRDHERGTEYKPLKVYVGDEQRSLWVALFNVDGKNIKIIFEPSDELIKAMKRQFPSKVKYIERR